MRVLVACDAVSCDLLPTEAPGPHITGDVVDVLSDGWDLMIAHPPCTYLSSSGLHWNKRVPGRAELTELALSFVQTLLDAPIHRIAIENPIGCISTRIRKPEQVVHPWQFGHDASKATCLWLKNLPPLFATEIVNPDYVCSCGYRFSSDLGKYGCANCCGDGRIVRRVYANQTASGQNRLAPSADRWKLRAATYPGIAEAMALQWGSLT